MFSHSDQQYQFQQPTSQQAIFQGAKASLDNNQSMLSLLNEDEFSQQQQPVNTPTLSYYGNHITGNNYGSLPSQVQRNYMQYAQQSQGLPPSPYTGSNPSYSMQQNYQRSNSYQAYSNQHAGTYYPNAGMGTASPYQSYATAQGYPNQGRSPVGSPNMVPAVTSVGPKYPPMPSNSVSPVMVQGPTMYSPSSAPTNKRNQFQFPSSPVPHPTRPSPIQSPNPLRRSPAVMTCPSPILSHSPAPVGSSNSTSPMIIKSPPSSSPSFSQSRSPVQAKQKQDMVDLSSMSKMYKPPSRQNAKSDKKHSYFSPKRGGPIPKMEEMVAFIGESTMRGILTPDKDEAAAMLEPKPEGYVENGKLELETSDMKEQNELERGSNNANRNLDDLDVVNENGNKYSKADIQATHISNEYNQHMTLHFDDEKDSIPKKKKVPTATLR